MYASSQAEKTSSLRWATIQSGAHPTRCDPAGPRRGGRMEAAALPSPTAATAAHCGRGSSMWVERRLSACVARRSREPWGPPGASPASQQLMCLTLLPGAPPASLVPGAGVGRHRGVVGCGCHCVAAVQVRPVGWRDRWAVQQAGGCAAPALRRPASVPELVCAGVPGLGPF